MQPTDYRLAQHAQPRRYDLALAARLGDAAFSGQVTIQLDIQESHDWLELHALDLQLRTAWITVDGQRRPGTITGDPIRQVATIRFAVPLPTGPATLEIAFDGQISQGLEGLYLAQDGQEQLLCTQCQATAARAIFPCFDEPSFKARFAYQITTAPEAIVLTNSPLLDVQDAPDGGGRVWTFAPTPPMSSYLVGIVIGDIAGTAEEVVQGTPVRVWAMRGKEAMGVFAHRYTVRLLPWYEDYFAVPYHFGKYDQVAVPGFAAGAMENSGLVLFRQRALLMDPRTAAWGQEKIIALIIAHEFAHMWFGNLVTMAWWDDLWLNEAFADWIAYKAVNALSPDYGIWMDFDRAKAATLEIDALETTHPIYTPVATPDETAELFDTITYTKGCAVLRMLEAFLGAEAFRTGMRSYIRAFAERNARGEDLWHHLALASQAPVPAIMHSWVLQSGYPVIAAAHAAGTPGTALHLAQQRCYARPGRDHADDPLWQVPLVIRYADSAGVHTITHLLVERTTTLPLDVAGTLQWCYLNADRVGFYRQDLDPALLAALLPHLDQLSPSEQIGLLDDQWALVHTGTRRIGQFLDVLAALLAFDDHHVLERVVAYLHNLEELLEAAADAEALHRFRRWVDAAFAGRQADLGFAPVAGESRNRSQQRVAVIDAMATLAQNPATQAAVAEWADREARDPRAVDPNLAGLFVQAAALAGDAAQFERNVAIYEQRKAASTTPQEIDRYLNSFVEFRHAALVARTLRLMDERVIPQEGVGPILLQMLRRRYAQAAA